MLWKAKHAWTAYLAMKYDDELVPFLNGVNKPKVQ